MAYDLEGKVVIVTGSSSGIGRGTAVAFAKEGAYVTITGRNAEGLKETKQLCVQAGLPEDRIMSVEGDLTEEAVRNVLVQKTLLTFSKIDVLVNSAGMVMPGNLETTKEEDFDVILKTNLKVVFLLTKAVMPHLIRTKGNVVNVSSIVGIVPRDNMLAYCMSKAALDQFTRCVALEVAPKGVRVNCVNPGVVPTNVFRHSGLSEEVIRQLLEKRALNTPMQRNGTVEDVVKGIMHLASENASYTTGHLLTIDGGTLFNSKTSLFASSD